MTEIRKAEKTERFLFKLIVVVLISALLIVLAVFSKDLFKAVNEGALDNSESFNSSMMCDRKVVETIDDIIKTYEKDPGSMDTRYNGKNYSFIIRDGNTYMPLWEVTNSNRNTFIGEYFVFESANGNDVVIYKNLINESDYKYRVEFSLADELKENTDGFYELKDSYELLHSSSLKSLIFSGLTITGIIILAVWLIRASGYEYGRDGVYLNFFNRIPLDALTLGIILWEIGTIFVTVNLIDGGYLDMNADSKLYVFSMSCVLLAIGLPVLWWLTSVSARIKAGTLLSNNLLTKLFKFLGSLVSGLPLVWKTILFLLVAGGGCLVFLFADAELLLAIWVLLCCLAVLWWSLWFQKVKRQASKVINGHLEPMDTDKMPQDLQVLANDLNDISDGLKAAVENELKGERLKAELITNVSHDIRTPLTSIINYVDLLQKEHTEEQEKEYLEVLARQSERLNKLTEDIIEASKASTGNVTVDITDIGVKEIIWQSVGEYENRFAEKQLTVVVSDIADDLTVKADGTLLWRVLNNIYSNIVKYALEGTRVYIDVTNDRKNVQMTFKNISAEALNVSADELMGRFVRGDDSRHTEGSGLGLNIAESLTTLMNGSLKLSIDGDLFKVNLELPKGK